MSNQENQAINYEFANTYADQNVGENAVILHKDFDVRSTEATQPFRSRFRGAFSTLDIASFFEYVKTRTAEEGAETHRTFIHAEQPQHQLAATTVLNFGSYNLPGHADDRAELVLRRDPLFSSFVDKTESWSTATDFAEVLEDFLGTAEIEAFNDGETIGFAKSIVGIRNAKIDRNSSSTLNTGALNYEQSDMEKIAIQAQAQILPTEFSYKTGLYLGLDEQVIKFRVVTRFEEKENGGTKVFYRLKAIGLLGHYLTAAKYFEDLVEAQLDNTLIGSFKK